MFIYVVLVLVLSFFCFMSNNVVLWWSVFLLMTLIFVSLNKSNSNFVVLINYFVIQEVLGMLFLLFSFFLFQLILLFLKVGVAPFHFWLFSVLFSVYDLNFLWFLTFQKLPFIFVFFQIGLYFVFFVLFLGLIFCYFQIFLLKNFKFLIIISSTESFNWFLMVNFFSFSMSLYMFFYYFILMLIILFKVNMFDFNFNTWESLLVFLNMPFTVTFFIKIFSLMYLVNNYIFLFFILFLMFLSSLSFGFWLVILSTKFNFFMEMKNNVFSFFLFVLTMFCIF